MTPAAALITAAEALEAQAAELRRKAAAFGGDDRNSAQADRLVELGVAVGITRLASATLYRIARRFDLGFPTSDRSLEILRGSPPGLCRAA